MDEGPWQVERQEVTGEVNYSGRDEVMKTDSSRPRLLAHFQRASKRQVGAFLLIVAFGLLMVAGLHGGSDAWAQPTHTGLRGTIPCPTPMPDSGAPLQEGWNLISIRVSPCSTVVTDVLSTIEGQYDLVYAYHASDTADPWKKYNTAAPPFLNDLTEIDETMGLWIRATEAVTLTVSGFAPGFTDIQLYSGWNLVGYPSQTTRSVTAELAGIEGKYDLVYAYDAWDADDPWKKYNTAAPPFLNDLTEIGPGRGYWIRVSQDCTWSVW